MSIHVTSRVLVPPSQFLEHWGENAHVFAGVVSGYYLSDPGSTVYIKGGGSHIQQT